MKILTSAQLHELDKYTIQNEVIRSIDLMERAAKALTAAIMEEWDTSWSVVVFAGPGNNGGDALAVARMLAERNYKVSVYLFNIHNQLTPDCATNKKKLVDSKKVKEFHEITLDFDPPKLDASTLVVDGLFGTGLNKPLSGGFASLVKYINQSPCKVVSIDVPSGLMTEDNTYNIHVNIIKADLTLTIQLRKLSMMLTDNHQYVGRLRIIDIGLSQDFIDNAKTPYTILEEEDVRAMLKPRGDFVHKGQMGTALIIAGSYGMAGAAVLSTRACLRAGVGKVAVHTPRRNYEIMQISIPEAVLQIDREEVYFSEAVDASDFDAVAIGPGIGIHENTAIALIAQIRRAQCPTVLDADALNILASHRAWMQQLPKDLIMTPHPRELDRLAGGAGTSDGCYERLSKAKELAQHIRAYILLKDHYSALCMPDGSVCFNQTGNSGMATAGSGDVLTGIITALCARGYKQGEACKLGMYLHGLAGDLAARDLGKESLIASDIINYLPKAFKQLED
ncbi:MAG: NAD(P)H-hydrate dehydratase [Prevotella sp.]|nr:NAD(P)H-hydrate dehydratase [Prevotella sp.]